MRRPFPNLTGGSLRATRPLTSVIGRVVLCLLAADAVVVGCYYWWEKRSLKAEERKVEFVPSSTKTFHTWWPFDHAGVERPTTMAPEAAGLNDADEVLGVEVNGRARAYRLVAMRPIERHVVNDVIDRVPVSVSYCDITDCTRAYSGRPGGAPLPIRQAGLSDGEMILKVEGAYYRQSTGQAVADPSAPAGPDTSRTDFPFPSLPLTRTTWKEWKRQHPATDLVGLSTVGQGRASKPSPR